MHAHLNQFRKRRQLLVRCNPTRDSSMPSSSPRTLRLSAWSTPSPSLLYSRRSRRPLERCWKFRSCQAGLIHSEVQEACKRWGRDSRVHSVRNACFIFVLEIHMASPALTGRPSKYKLHVFNDVPTPPWPCVKLNFMSFSGSSIRVVSRWNMNDYIDTCKEIDE